jgi:hypothetical protein
MSKKNIMPPLDIPGKTISWTMNDKRYYGEVIKVRYRPFPHPEYPNSCNRILRKFMTVLTMDGIFLTIPGDHQALKLMKAVPFPV